MSCRLSRELAECSFALCAFCTINVHHTRPPFFLSSAYTNRSFGSAMTAAKQTLVHPVPTECRDQRLRLGVVLDSMVVPRWVHRILKKLDESDFAELALIVSLNSSSNGSSHTVRFADFRPVIFQLWRQLDAQLFLNRSMRPEAFSPVRFVPENSHPELLECLTTANGAGISFSQDNIERIKRSRLDLILHLAERVSNGEGHDWARYGVWSFDDPNKLANSLFWSLYDNKRMLENGLNIVTNQGESGRMPCSYFASDSLSFFRNHSNTCWARSQILLRSLAELHCHGWQSIQGSLLVPGPSQRSAPGNLDTSRLLPRLLNRAVRDHITKHYLREQWFVAFRRVSASEEPESAPSHFAVLRPPRDHFYADPFVVERNGQTYIFFEDYSFEKGKGVISFVEVDAEGGCSQPELALEENYHVSFPSVFQWKGEFFLLPETKNNRTIQLYRATAFPRRWQLVSVLIGDVAAVDPVMLCHGGKFWLFTSGLGTADLWFEGRNELSLFFSDSLFGPWTAHPRNPIVTDLRRSRSAGQLFFHGGQLIRPAQDCSVDYGYAVSLNRVDVLSEADYRETPIGTIAPDWIPNNRGTHTFNRSHTCEVLDGRTLIGRFTRGSTRPLLETVTVARPLITYISSRQNVL